MDPKMDSGYLKEGETLDHEYDILGDLLPEEVVGIMDQMFCFEVSRLKITQLLEDSYLILI